MSFSSSDFSNKRTGMIYRTVSHEGIVCFLSHSIIVGKEYAHKRVGLLIPPSIFTIVVYCKDVFLQRSVLSQGIPINQIVLSPGYFTYRYQRYRIHRRFIGRKIILYQTSANELKVYAKGKLICKYFI